MAPKKVERTPCTVYSRCCGWYVPKTAGNPGKQAEYGDRKMYDIKKAI